jgi:hypothetical protein
MGDEDEDLEIQGGVRGERSMPKTTAATRER